MSEIINELYKTIVERKSSPPESSYTASLFHKGSEKIAQKFGEEAIETVIAATKENKSEIISESADLLYHLLVLWADNGVAPDDVDQELKKRTIMSGLEEKASRG